MSEQKPNALQRFRPEDPARIEAFRRTVDAIDWDKDGLIPGLRRLFEAVDGLAEAEVHYYYRRRLVRAAVSSTTRIAAWLLGSVGLLLPLLAGVNTGTFQAWGPYGYVFLAAAASCLAANALFGGTDGHIRFTSTQLELERLITAARVAWCKYLASEKAPDPAATEQAFALIHDYADGLHTITIAETGHWGETLRTELAKYQKTLDAKGAAAGRKS